MNASRGFSLVELAVALAIIALLLAGAMIPLSTQIDVRNVTDTQRAMESIREAIIGFAQANGRLPCPATGSVASGTAGAGTEVPSVPSGGNTCTNNFGVVPWATLGVPETDSWGRRFSYWVSPIFTDAISLNTFGAGCTPAPNPPSSFALCSLGTLTVNTRNEITHAATAVGLVLPAVIISHGKNGFGAFTPGGATFTAPVGADEIANATHTGAATTFFSRTYTPRASTCNDAAGPSFCEFDDVVVMITSNLLIARMVAAGRLP